MRDSAFIRGKIPMTKSEVRAVVLSRLELSAADIVYDIGAGTGSVSVEAARLVPAGHVYAFERTKEGCQLIRQNANRFGIQNLTVVPGEAPGTLSDFPAPDCVFVGGSGGRAMEILSAVTEKNPGVRIVFTVIALESLSEILACLRKAGLETDTVCLQVSRAEKRGSHSLMLAQNPVFVIAAEAKKTGGGRDETEPDSRIKIPRLLLAAPASQSGKTVITAGLLALFQSRGMDCVSFKCGPDYIDPLFHRSVSGVPCYNLDSFFQSDGDIRRLFIRKVQNRDLALIEGVMGYYDGLSAADTRASTYEIARAADTPVILVLDGKKSSLSLAAEAKGFASYKKDSRIAGVIINRCAKSRGEELKSRFEELGLAFLGCVPVCREAELASRHLGLILPQEQDCFQERIKAFAGVLADYLNIDGILALAKAAPALAPPPASGVQETRVKRAGRIGVARDDAFCFYYQDNLDFLKENGWELIEFSPLQDEALPENLDAVLFGGGYPEQYAMQLSQNESFLADFRIKAAASVKILAECGGFLYLHSTLEGTDGVKYPLAGLIGADAFRKERSGRFGYVSIRGGDMARGIRGHEFHYWESTAPGTDMTAEKPSGNRSWPCMYRTEKLLAGFPHLYYRSNPSFILSFLDGRKV